MIYFTLTGGLVQYIKDEKISHPCLTYLTFRELRGHVFNPKMTHCHVKIQLYALWEKLGFFNNYFLRCIIAHVRSSCRRRGRWTVPRSGTRSRDSACLDTISWPSSYTVCTPHQWITSSYKLYRLRMKRNALIDVWDSVSFVNFAKIRYKYRW